jgi:hypothetical protein
MIVFVSAHLDLSQDEFRQHYVPQIDNALDAGHSIIVGDANGGDTFTQKYLAGKTNNVTVYHMLKKPRNNVGKYLTNGGYISDNKRDSAMTRDSDYDITWVRSVEEQKKLYGKNYRHRISGVQKNLNRRT